MTQTDTDVHAMTSDEALLPLCEVEDKGQVL